MERSKKLIQLQSYSLFKETNSLDLDQLSSFTISLIQNGCRKYQSLITLRVMINIELWFMILSALRCSTI